MLKLVETFIIWGLMPYALLAAVGSLLAWPVPTLLVLGFPIWVTIATAIVTVFWQLAQPPLPPLPDHKDEWTKAFLKLAPPGSLDVEPEPLPTPAALPQPPKALPAPAAFPQSMGYQWRA